MRREQQWRELQVSERAEMMGVEAKALPYLESRLEEFSACRQRCGRCGFCRERTRLWYKYGTGCGDAAADRMAKEKPFAWRGRTEPLFERRGEGWPASTRFMCGNACE